MKILNLFSKPIPSNIADAHISIMDAINGIPQYYLDRFKVDRIIITDYSNEEFMRYVTLVDLKLQALVLTNFHKSTDTNLLKHNLLSIYIRGFLTLYPSLEDVLLEQSRAIPLRYKISGGHEFNARDLFIFLFAAVASGASCERVQQPFVHFFKRADQHVKYGHLSVQT